MKLFKLFKLFIGVIMIALGFMLILGTTSCSRGLDKKDIGTAYLIVGLDNKGNSIRARNDLTLLLVKTTNGYDVISYPRDTLVEIPERGKWLINSLNPFCGAVGMARTMEYISGYRIKGFLEIDLQGCRNLVASVPMLNSVAGNPEKSVRERKHLPNELHRQLRIQAFLKYIHNNKFGDVVPSVLLSKLLIANATYTDMNVDDLTSLLSDIRRNNVEFKMGSGHYRTVVFDYAFIKQPHVCWILDEPIAFTNMHNPYVYPFDDKPKRLNIKTYTNALYYSNFIIHKKI
jgi:hypothetical protein